MSTVRYKPFPWSCELWYWQRLCSNEKQSTTQFGQWTWCFLFPPVSYWSLPSKALELQWENKTNETLAQSSVLSHTCARRNSWVGGKSEQEKGNKKIFWRRRRYFLGKTNMSQSLFAQIFKRVFEEPTEGALQKVPVSWQVRKTEWVALQSQKKLLLYRTFCFSIPHCTCVVQSLDKTVPPDCST